MDNKKKTILIIEDEPPILRILTDTFSENAFKTIMAKSGEEGLDLALKKHPDLIILDIVMPGMDGLEVIKKLREDAWGKTAAVIILSNVNPDTTTSLQQIIESKPVYYFIKSDIKLDQIVEKVNEIFATNQQAND